MRFWLFDIHSIARSRAWCFARRHDAFVGPEEPALRSLLINRGVAARQIAAGADGICAFNWHANADSLREHMTTMGDAATLVGSDCIFPVGHRTVGRGAPANDQDRIDAQLPVELHPTLDGRGPRLALFAGGADGSPAARAFLRVRLAEFVAGDEVRVWFEGEALPPPESVEYALDPAGHTYVSGAVWLTYPLGAVFDAGRGAARSFTVEVGLAHRHPQMESALMLSDVEVALVPKRQPLAAL